MNIKNGIKIASLIGLSFLSGYATDFYLNLQRERREYLEALDEGRIHTVYLDSLNSDSSSIEDSLKLSENWQRHFKIINNGEDKIVFEDG